MLTRRCNFAVLFSTFLLSLAILTAPAVAQNPGTCVPDCPETPFGSSMFAVVTLPGGCLVLVEYAQRNACHIWWDVAIIKVTPLNPLCNTLTISQIINQATTALLIQNPMGFPPGPGQPCATNWRVIKGACWKSVENPCGDVALEPCGEACCLQPYTVCIDSAGVRTVTSGPPVQIGQCDPQPGCEFICDGNSPIGIIKIGVNGEVQESSDGGKTWELIQPARTQEMLVPAKEGGSIHAR